MNRGFAILCLVVACVLGWNVYEYFSGSGRLAVVPEQHFDCHELKGRARLLTDTVIGMFSSSETVEQDILDFKSDCLAMKGTEMEMFAGYCYQYCNLLMEMNKKRGELFDRFDRKMTSSEKLSTSLGKRSSQRNSGSRVIRISDARSGEIKQWDIYCEHKRAELERLFVKISVEETNLLKANK